MSTFDYFVAKGSHRSREDGMCSMEWTAFLAGEPHSDKPVCVSPLLRDFCIAFNDALPDDLRQRLRPYLARTIGTADDGRDKERAWLCADWLVRVCVPAWLDLTGLTVLAARLRALPEIASPGALDRAGPVLAEARSEATAVGAAALTVAAWTVAGIAAHNVAWTATWAAQGAACGAAGAAACAAACAAARDTARAAAWTAAEAAFRPTVVGLQRSTFDLLDRMLPTEPITLPALETADLGRVPVGVR